jgi:dienelactone hydrolase
VLSDLSPWRLAYSDQKIFIKEHFVPESAFSPVHEQLIASVPLRDGARIQTETVPYQHDGLELEGYLAHDASHDEPRPAVLIVHDWTGVGPNVEMRAQMLARLGYVAFAADIYGKGIRPTGDDASALAQTFYKDLPLLRARVDAGYRRLAADPRVDSNRIAVIGYCFGGSATLEFARTGADARGFVSFHGGLIVHDPSDASAIRGPLLVLTGAADPVVPDETIDAFKAELRAAGDLDWQLVSYSGAPHAFTVPGSDRYRPVADARSWRELVGFLDEVLG